MLSIGLDIARSALTASGEQSAVVARNIANSGSPLASRKIANLTTAPGGGVVVASVTRASNDALTKSLLTATSSAAGQRAVAGALEQLEATVNDPELNASAAANAGTLRDALLVLSTSPDNISAAASAIDAAKRLATSLNEASNAIQHVRQTADAGLNTSVNTVNSLLAKFETVNREIVKGTLDGTDVTDQLDARDSIVRSLAEELGIRTITRAGNDMAIFTDSGLTLFDVSARRVTMVPSPVLTPGATGNSVSVDGVPVTGSGAPMASQSGRISGLAQVRDTYAVTYSRQTDEIARGLIEAFSEQDQSASPSLPDIAGLFTYSGGPAVPPSGITVPGLANSISVNVSVDPSSGGNPRLLRDGSIGSPGTPAYTYNQTGAAGYSGRVEKLIDSLTAARPFDTANGLGSPAGLIPAAASSSGWLENVRQKAASDAEYRTTLMDRTHEALSRSTGVSLDDDMTSLLEIERAYQTSSKLLTMIDNMFTSLLNAT